RRALAGAVVAVLVAGATAGALLRPASSSPKPAARATTSPSPRAAGPADPLALAQAATVRLLLGSPGSSSGWGSGTVVDPHGLILTNAHVAQPQAPGQAVALGAPGSTLPEDPTYLTVELTSGQSSPAVAKYRAKPVAVDGYRDLAVVRIYADAAGRPVDPASLSLPSLRIGSTAALKLGQPLTVLGFPGVSESESITLTTGVLSTFVPDPLHHVPGERFELETTARVAHGNSGGAAVDAAGLLIGVPSMEVTGEGADVSWRLRGADQALPLLAAARAGRPYRSSVLVERSGVEHMAGVGTGPDAASACAGGAAPGTADRIWVGVRYTGLRTGEDLALGIRLPDGSDLADRVGVLPQGTADREDGCFAYPIQASELRLAALPAGAWTAQLYTGPALTELGGTVQFQVSTTT
ncbi:S1 family peptidase, partial [Streptacidiphilus monticola]